MDEYLFKTGWKDSLGNTAVFTKENGKIFLNVDGSDCSEGIEEEVSSMEEILKTLEWYGYNRLADIIKNSGQS